MKTFVFAVVAAAGLSASAGAGIVCASPQEMKVLQSAALQQQLMVAALTCRMSADYNSFVTTFRGKLIQSDRALKDFFAKRRRGEDYNAYKTRIANTVSLKSLHDPQFCENAQKVFDIALGRGGERRGLAPEPPQLIETGYEGCRPVDDKLITAEAKPAMPAVKPAPRPRIEPAKPAGPRLAALQPVKKTPAPKPVLSPKAEAALALAKKPTAVPQPRPAVRMAGNTVKPVAAPKPVAMPASEPAPVAVPAPVIEVSKLAAVSPKPAAPQKLAALPPARMKEIPALPAAPAVAPKEQSGEPEGWRDTVVEQTPAPAWQDQYADDQDQDYSPQDYPDETLYTRDPQPRVAAVERPRWRRVERNPPAYRDEENSEDAGDNDPYAGNNVPYAYRPGTVWVNDDGPGLAPARYAPPPRWRRPPPRARMVLGPDGRWIMVVRGGPRWVRY